MILQEIEQSLPQIPDPVLQQIAIQEPQSPQKLLPENPPYLSLAIAVTLIITWATSLVYFLFWDLSQLNIQADNIQVNLWQILVAMLWQTFLYTGLFITAHDAMHGSIFPKNPKLNHILGRICVELYAVFSYQKLRQKHYQHHRYPASKQDPDFHDCLSHPDKAGFWSWYFYFMKNYWHWRCWVGLSIVYILAAYLFKIPTINLWLFWIIPAILSSLQLFYFGTYLPHREPETGYENPHRAKSVDLPWMLSFLSCYHFGYHQEHHEFPQIPWWQLPKIHQHKKLVSSTISSPSEMH